MKIMLLCLTIFYLFFVHLNCLSLHIDLLDCFFMLFWYKIISKVSSFPKQKLPTPTQRNVLYPKIYAFIFNLQEG